MNLIKKILVAQTAVLALWAMSAQAATDEAIAERLRRWAKYVSKVKSAQPLVPVLPQPPVVQLAAVPTCMASSALPAMAPVC